jgi:hypothetical protein
MNHAHGAGADRWLQFNLTGSRITQQLTDLMAVDGSFDQYQLLVQGLDFCFVAAAT